MLLSVQAGGYGRRERARAGQATSPPRRLTDLSVREQLSGNTERGADCFM